MLQNLLQKRSNGYYYFRWVCPPAVRKLLGKREVVKSLRTTSKLQALARAGSLYALVDRLKSSCGEAISFEESSGIHMNQELRSKIKAAQIKINEYVITDQAQHVFKQLGQKAYEPFPMVVLDIACDLELEIIEKTQNDFVEMLFHSHFQRLLATSLLEAEDFLPDTYHDAVIWRAASTKLLERIHISKTNRLGEYERGKTLREFIESEIDLFSAISGWKFKALMGVISTNPRLYEQALTDLQDALHAALELVDSKFSFNGKSVQLKMSVVSPIDSTYSKSPASLPHPQAKSLSVVYGEFLDHKINVVKLSEDIQKEYAIYFEAIIHFIGDKPIDVITKKMVKACLDQYAMLPRRNINPYKGLPVGRLLELEIPDKHLVSSKTVGQVRRLLQGIFRYAVDLEYIKESPVSDLNLPPEKINARGAFSKTQLRTLLSGAEDFGGKDEWKKWVIRLAVFTGARAGEIAQARGMDVLQDQDSGIYFLRITPEAGSLKTQNAFRRVPIHSELLRMGFIEFAHSRVPRLFPEIKSSKDISRWFPYYRTALNIPSETDLSEKLVFHGFRHSFVTVLRGAGASTAQLQQIVGHEKTGAGVTDRYTSQYDVQSLKKVIELFSLSV